MKNIFLACLIFCSALVRAEIVGQMTANGEVYVITSDICKTADGKDAKGWLMSYSYNSIGIANRSCYQKFNDNIWIWEFTGREYFYPASNFKPATPLIKAKYLKLSQFTIVGVYQCFLQGLATADRSLD